LNNQINQRSIIKEQTPKKTEEKKKKHVFLFRESKCVDFSSGVYSIQMLSDVYNLLSDTAAVRIRALHVVCDSSWDLKDELWSSVKQTLFFSPEDTVHIQCAILHSVLLQRQAFKHLGQGQLYLW